MGRKTALDKQADEIMKIAEDSGVRSNFFFRTTFQRYLVQVKNADRIEAKLKALDDNQITTTKSYQKGEKNLYINPLFSEFNKTTDSANKTVNTLLKIIREFKVGSGEDEKKEEDPLVKLINGGEDYGEDDD